jgi:hypothetical protein
MHRLEQALKTVMSRNIVKKDAPDCRMGELTKGIVLNNARTALTQLTNDHVKGTDDPQALVRLLTAVTHLAILSNLSCTCLEQHALSSLIVTLLLDKKTGLELNQLLEDNP